jgi:hypothetical protein
MRWCSVRLTKFNSDVKPLDDVKGPSQSPLNAGARFYKTPKAPILWSDGRYVPLGHDEALP